jgi:hypothetical protein
VRTEIHNSAFTNPLLKIPAGAPDQAVDSAIEFTQDSHITAIFPHTHLRGKGSHLEATARYDNSVSNRFNPNPNIDVRWGEQTWDEMQY